MQPRDCYDDADQMKDNVENYRLNKTLLEYNAMHNVYLILSIPYATTRITKQMRKVSHTI